MDISRNLLNIKTLFHPSRFENTGKETPSNPRTLQKIREEREQRFSEKIISTLESPGTFPLTPNDKKLLQSNTSQLFKNLYGETLLTYLFFSKENVQNIQNLIRFLVYKETSKIIDNQSNNELLTIMRSIFLEYSAHPPLIDENMSEQEKAELFVKYTSEVKRLNNIVIEDILPRVISQLQQYLDYLRDASSTSYQQQNPINDSIMGQKEYRSATQVWFGGDL